MFLHNMSYNVFTVYRCKYLIVKTFFTLVMQKQFFVGLHCGHAAVKLDVCSRLLFCDYLLCMLAVFLICLGFCQVFVE